MTLKALFSTSLFFSVIVSLSNSMPTTLSFSTGGYQLFTLQDIPEGGRQEHAVVNLKPDTIAIVGGITPNESAEVAPFSSTDLVQLYSIADDTWRTVAPLPQPLNHPNVAAANGKIYVFGGLDDGNAGRTKMTAVSDSWVYDPAADTWSSIPPLDVARAQAALAVCDGIIFVAGGFTELIINEQHPLPATLTQVSVFDTDTLTWVTDSLPEKAKNLPEPRDHARTAILDGKIYVMGGFNFGGFNQTDTVFILDLQNLEAGWESSSARMPTPRATFASGVIGRKIFTIGGEGNSTAQSATPIRLFDEVEVYDVDSNAWTQLTPLPVPRQGEGVAVDGKLYMPGGTDEAPVKPLSKFEGFMP